MSETTEKTRFSVKTDNVDRELLRAFDRAIDDIETGREYSVKEGIQSVFYALAISQTTRCIRGASQTFCKNADA